MDIQTLAAAIAVAKKINSTPEYVTAAVEAWLSEHVDPSTGYVLDDTLSTQGAAADAKAVGDKIADLKSAIDGISELVQPENHIIPSSDYAWGITSDMTVTYGDESALFEYPYASGNKTNFGFVFEGLEHGKTYVLSFDVTSGAIASAKISGLDRTKNNVIYSAIATMTNSGSHYSCEFNAYFSSQTFYNALNITMARATSTTATLSNFSLTLKDETSHYEIDRDVVRNLTEESFSDEVQAKLDYSTLAYSDDNLIDTSNVTHGYINASNGTISDTGSTNAVTDFIPVEAGKTYYFNNVLYGYYAFYSSASETDFISGQTYTDARSNWYLTIPEGVTYARFTVDETKLAATWMNTINREPLNKDVVVLNDNILTAEEYPDNPCNYNGSEISIFNKILCIGDSLTSGVCNYTEGGSSVANVAFPDYAYPKYLQKLSGVETTNMGLAGRTTAQWYSAKADADLSGYDMAIIQLGVNDVLYNNGWTQEEETALGNIVTKLKTENTGIKIFIATIIPAFSYSGTKFDSVSNGIREFVETANDPDIMLVDLALYGHTEEDIAYNNGHLTGFGYLTLAHDYKAYISHIIANNKKLFRFVQFIGTNHQP